MNNYSFIKLKLLEDNNLKFSSFIEFNSYLINYNIKLSILNYIEYIQSNLFKEIDINIFKKFINYNKLDEIFVITAIELNDYKLINDIKDRTIKSFILKNNLKINLDYKIRKINNLANKSKNQLEYKFTVNSLKNSLILNNNIYIQYFLLIEKSIFYYEEYQKILFYKLGFMKDIKLDKLTKLYENQQEVINKLCNTINNINSNNLLIYDNLNIAHEKINNLTNIIENPIIKTKLFIYIFGIYKISKDRYIYINSDKDLYNFKVKELKLKYNLFNKYYERDYNKKYINIISKIKNKFKLKIQFFNSEIILKSIEIEELIDYIELEMNQLI